MGLFDFLRSLFGSGDDGTGADETAGAGRGRAGDAAAGPGGGGDATARTTGGDEAPPGEIFADSREELREEATDFTEFWSEHDLDFTPASVARLDEMFATQYERANVMQVETEEGRVGQFAPIACGAAAYFGETIVRNYDAQWLFDEDFGWALQFGGGEIVNVFGTAHRGLETGPPFVATHDTFVEEMGLDGAPIEAGGDRAGVVSVDDGGGIDPDEFDEAAIEDAAADRDAETIAQEFGDDADDFVASFPGYDLDYSAQSLARVDQVVANELSGGKFADAEVGAMDDEASILLTAKVVEAGAYFAEVFRRTTDADWHYPDEGGPQIELPGEAADARMDPVGIAEKCIAGDGSFAGHYQAAIEVIDEVDSMDAGDES